MVEPKPIDDGADPPTQPVQPILPEETTQPNQVVQGNEPVPPDQTNLADAPVQEDITGQSTQVTDQVIQDDEMVQPIEAYRANQTSQPVLSADVNPVVVKNLTKQFNDQVVVDNVSFEIAPGTVFGFIGPSGGGKTTTVRMLTGIYLPTSGEVRVLGHNPSQFTRHDRERIGYMPQHFVLYPELTVWENLSFAASIYGVGFGRSKRMKELLDFVELWKDRNKRVHQISGGMQRRLSLATTLIHKPDFLFLDEPTTGLDPVLRKKLWDYFHDLKEQGITLFVTTQYVSDAAYCDQVGMISEGKLIALDTPTGLRRQALGGEVVILTAVDRVDYQRIQSLGQLPFVTRADRSGENEVRVTVDDASTAIPEILEWTKYANLEVESIQEFQPAYDDVFVSLIRKESQNA